MNDPIARTITDRTFGWGKYADRLQIHQVAGEHQTHLQRPYVDAVANRVRPFLEANRPMRVVRIELPRASALSEVPLGVDVQR